MGYFEDSMLMLGSGKGGGRGKGEGGSGSGAEPTNGPDPGARGYCPKCLRPPATHRAYPRPVSDQNVPYCPKRMEYFTVSTPPPDRLKLPKGCNGDFLV